MTRVLFQRPILTRVSESLEPLLAVSPDGLSLQRQIRHSEGHHLVTARRVRCNAPIRPNGCSDVISLPLPSGFLWLHLFLHHSNHSLHFAVAVRGGREGILKLKAYKKSIILEHCESSGVGTLVGTP
jgi:hypothetical protein